MDVQKRATIFALSVGAGAGAAFIYKLLFRK